MAASKKNKVIQKKRNYSQKQDIKDNKKIHFINSIKDLNAIFKSLYDIFTGIFKDETSYCKAQLLLLVFAILSTNSSYSVRSLFFKFANKYSAYKLNSFYGVLEKAKNFKTLWGIMVLEMAMKLITKLGKDSPIQIIIDDTLVEKAGQNFAGYAKHHDHTQRNGTNFLYGNCFVAIYIRIAINTSNGKQYVEFPFALRMWDKDEGLSKLEIASQQLKAIIEAIHKADKEARIVILCDSWYTKGCIAALANEENVDIIGGIRNDTVLYNKDKPEHSGRVGRPAGYRRISKNDIKVNEVEGFDFKVGAEKVRTDLFGKDRVVTVYRTVNQNENDDRLFISTAADDFVDIDLAILNNDDLKTVAKKDPMLTPLCMYRSRWAIEVFFYEQKNFWGLQNYQVRNKNEIEAFLNLQVVIYAILSLLPFLKPHFECFSELESIQDRRFELGQFILQLAYLQKIDITYKLSDSSSKAAEVFKNVKTAMGFDIDDLKKGKKSKKAKSK